MPVRIAEVIEATSTKFTAGAYELLKAPPFGALVRAQARDDSMAIYGLVYDIRTGSRDFGARAVVRGRTYAGRAVYDAEIYREHPDLAEVLQTEFSAVIVGFVEHGEIRQFLPPQPPPVHYSVYECDADEVTRFNQAVDYFRTVLFTPQIPGDEALAAALRIAARVSGDAHAFLVRAGREIASLLNDDYDRLTAILRRLRS
ncbi:HAS-barrel domain-containing protein [Roseiflexus sp.]|uniref:HAS-barrel domain-containing protein n=1 Tax=Roseiflexus sp. TaxID=2562120 RepID=UPI0021DD3B4A|nr:HAS-barrel domain-containing protein [Roseiflexus sp.]GIW00178.1 MAG: hypothetical protein KatS3mg058_1581 [Roseiflexus sp.]